MKTGCSEIVPDWAVTWSPRHAPLHPRFQAALNTSERNLPRQLFLPRPQQPWLLHPPAPRRLL